MDLLDAAVGSLNVTCGIFVAGRFSTSSESIYSSDMLRQLFVVLTQDTPFQREDFPARVSSAISSDEAQAERNGSASVIEPVHEFQRIFQSYH
jgi:hypothetical protein